MHKVETWNRASAAEVDGIACCIFSESAHTTSAREHTTRNVGARPRMWTACIAHVFDMLTFVSHLPSSTFFPQCKRPSKYLFTYVSQIQHSCTFDNKCHAASRRAADAAPDINLPNLATVELFLNCCLRGGDVFFLIVQAAAAADISTLAPAATHVPAAE